MEAQLVQRTATLRREDVEGFWPRNALDLWWRAAKRSPDPEMLALSMLDHWRRYATYQLSGFLDIGHMIRFLEDSNGLSKALMTDRLSTAPLFAISAYRKLRAAYSGNCMRVERSGDNVQLSIGLVGATLDVAALLTHVGANDGRVVDIFDQYSSNDFNSGVTGTQRPRIVISGTLQTTTKGVPTMDYVSGSSQRLSGPSAGTLGFTNGSQPAITWCIVASADTGNYLCGLGRSTTSTDYSDLRVGVSLDGGGANAKCVIGDTNGNGLGRTYYNQGNDFATGHRTLLAYHAAGTGAVGFSFQQDGSDLGHREDGSQASHSMTLFSGAASRWGCVSGASSNPVGFMTGKTNFLALFSSVIGAHDSLVVNQEMARHT